MPAHRLRTCSRRVPRPALLDEPGFAAVTGSDAAETDQALDPTSVEAAIDAHGVVHPLAAAARLICSAVAC